MLKSYATLGDYSSGHSCGYCGQSDTSRSYGFSSPFMTAELYEGLLNRGWRRSGRYLYKPDLKHTCCKLYPIRCEAEKFKSRREQRKDVNRFNRYIKGEDWDSKVSQYMAELKIRKLRENGLSNDTPTSKPKNEYDLIATVHAAEYSVLTETLYPEYLEPAHKFTIELDSDQCTDEKYQLYRKYQHLIHHESYREINKPQFTRFLCSSPLREDTFNDKDSGRSRKTGSYHQLYRIDGKLVAFGVLDLLPSTVSSVYFIYDPDEVGKFGMGKVSAMREVAFCIEEGYKYYALGLFAYGCEKLRYKAEINPSELLDVETGLWHPYEDFKTLFDQGRGFVTFPEDINSTTEQGPFDPDSKLSPRRHEDYILSAIAVDRCPLPYNPDEDLKSPLFAVGMPGVHPRDLIVGSEGVWSDALHIHEKGKVVRYWNSEAARDADTREDIREMVAVLGLYILQIIIWIP